MRAGARRQHFLWARSGQRSAAGREQSSRSKSLCVSGSRSRALWGGGVRRSGPSVEHRRKAAATEIALRSDRIVLLRRAGCADCEVAEAELSRRTRNYRCEQNVFAEESTRSSRDGAWHGVARYRHARIADGRRTLYSGDRKAAGTDGGVSGGNCLPERLHHSHASGADRKRHEEQQLWGVSTRYSGDRKAAGTDGGVSGGNCLPERLHHSHASGADRKRHEEQQLWGVST